MPTRTVAPSEPLAASKENNKTNDIDSFVFQNEPTDDSERNEEEMLPFAMTAVKGGRTNKPLEQHVRWEKENGLSSEFSLGGSSSLPPALVSSNGTSCSESTSSSSSRTASAPLASTSVSLQTVLLQTHDSQDLEAAASLLQQKHPYSFLGGMSSNLTTRSLSDHSAGVSQLLEKAGDTHDISKSPTRSISRSIISRQHRLPALPEEATIASTTSSLFLSPSSFHEIHPTSLPKHQQENQDSREQSNNTFFGNFFNPSQTIVPASSSYLQQQEPGIQQEERRLASLAGASASLTGPESFQVSVDLVLSKICLKNVMDIVGSPRLLHLWLDSLAEPVVITSTSDGATNTATTRSGAPAEANREYEGEWIEGTTAHLVSPRNASCFYDVRRAAVTALGFPFYGKVSMFVERPKGHVSLTIGQFDGGIEVHHKLKVCPIVSDQQPKIRIVDDVRLQREGLRVLAPFERCLLPSVNDYMDQVLSSLARLRFLVENNGEEKSSIIYTPPAEDGGSSLSAPLLQKQPRASRNCHLHAL